MASRYNYYGNIRAPEFPADVEWLNTGRRLSLAALRGKFVLLDFWTYGCINCIHIIPDLKRLEALYSNELVVIGVHSAKFSNEGELKNLRQIILRYELEHPVVNDRDFRIWQAYAVRAWPTTVLIDPRGYVLAAHSGERVFDAYNKLLAAAVQEYDARGLLNREPLGLILERTDLPEATLSFPGKILADEAGQRLFIADSNHHRVIVTDLEGEVQAVIGTGARGLIDGAFGEARFSKPQGMALDGQRLYIADTENHALRVADLQTGQVETLAGDGTLNYAAATTPTAQARLNSPWDLALVERKLYIAMAGMHQLWVLDFEQDRIGPYAGSGREGMLDGPLAHATLAQPSGITSDGQVLYFADSEASAVRLAELKPGGKVKTIIGEGLFEFGDRDGAWPEAHLQHALGILYYRGALYVADTYNHKLKLVDPVNQRVRTLVGSGEPGWKDDGPQSQFYEPGGLSGAGGKLYVADTNNHLIRVVDPITRTVSTLLLRDPQGLLIKLERETAGQVIRLPAQRVRPGQGTICLELQLPAGYKVNEEAPSAVIWEPTADGVMHLDERQRKISLVGRDFPVCVEAAFQQEGRVTLKGQLSLYYCAAQDENVCLIRLAQLELPLEVTPNAATSEAAVPLKISVPQ